MTAVAIVEREDFGRFFESLAVAATNRLVRPSEIERLSTTGLPALMIYPLVGPKTRKRERTGWNVGTTKLSSDMWSARTLSKSIYSLPTTRFLPWRGPQTG